MFSNQFYFVIFDAWLAAWLAGWLGGLGFRGNGKPEFWFWSGFHQLSWLPGWVIGWLLCWADGHKVKDLLHRA